MFSGGNVLKKRRDGRLVSGSLVIEPNGDSYSYNQLISRRIGNYIFLNTYRFSNTTSRHQSIVRSRAESTLFKTVYIEVPDEKIEVFAEFLINIDNFLIEVGARKVINIDDCLIEVGASKVDISLHSGLKLRCQEYLNLRTLSNLGD